MTDARLQGRWLTDPVFDALSDRAFRTYCGSLMWSAEAGTDGRLPARSLRLLHPEGVDAATADELVTSGRWEQTDAGYQVTNWAHHQSLAEQVAQAREDNRRRQAEWRARQRERATGQQGPAAVTGDVTRYGTDDITRESLRPGESKAHLDQGELAGTRSARATGCDECQRLRAFGQPPCPHHRAAS